MPKQTVEQRYKEQQAMKSERKPRHHANIELKTSQQQDIQKICNATKQSLQEAQQAVRQAQYVNPTQAQLQIAEGRLQNAVQLMQQLFTIAPNMVLGISKGEQQHLKQLDYQIEKAVGTLNSLQQSMESQ